MGSFADTSGFFAVVDIRDRWHEPALRFWREAAARQEVLFTSNYVLLETLTLLQCRLGLQSVGRFVTDVLPVLQVLWIDEAIHEAALAAWLAAGRRELSLVDCSSFVLMRRYGLRTAFTFDPHFAEQQFAVVPVVPDVRDDPGAD